LLAGIEGVPTLPVLVAYEHHMGWSGTGGYPTASKPPNLASQITAVADTWDTLLQARGPLVPGARTARAARTLDRLAGELLHPDLVRVFLELVGLSDLGRGDEGSKRRSQERSP
jgi:response regulator RpfG family c-di-GMP phosphodiesterase